MSSEIPFDICGFYSVARETVRKTRPGVEFSPRTLNRLNRFGGVQMNRGGEWPPTDIEKRCGSCALTFFAKLTDGRVKQSGISGQCQTNRQAADRAANQAAKQAEETERAASKAARKAAALAVTEATAPTQLPEQMTVEPQPPSLPATEQG